MKESKSWGLYLAVGLVILAFAAKGYAGSTDPYWSASQLSDEELIVCVPSSEYVKTYKNIISEQFEGLNKTSWAYLLVQAIQTIEDEASFYATCPEGQNASHSLFYVDGLSGQKTQLSTDLSMKFTKAGIQIQLSKKIAPKGTMSGGLDFLFSAPAPAGSYVEAVTTCCTPTKSQSPILRFDVSPTGGTTPRTGTSLVPDNRMPNPVNEPARAPSWLTQPVPPAPEPGPFTR